MLIVYIAYQLQLEGNMSGKSCHGNTFSLQIRNWQEDKAGEK